LLIILSNATIESLVIKVSKNIEKEIMVVPGYNTWVQELITAQFSGSKPEVGLSCFIRQRVDWRCRIF